jgi:hypothetical protein
MTTIAANRKEMACDSRTSWDGGDFCTVSDKVERIGDSLVGCCGSVDAIFKFLEWFRKRGDRPEFDADGFTAVELNAKGMWLYANSTYCSRVCDPFVTIGSGSMAAKAAMLCGHSPAEAVSVACKCDKHSAGPVRTFSLKGS